MGSVRALPRRALGVVTGLRRCCEAVRRLGASLRRSHTPIMHMAVPGPRAYRALNPADTRTARRRIVPHLLQAAADAIKLKQACLTHTQTYRPTACACYNMTIMVLKVAGVGGR